MTLPAFEEPLYLDFPPEEFHQRYRRARDLMNRDGLDGLLITSQRNYIYFTGHSTTRTFPHWLWTLSDARPFIAVLPRDNHPFLVIHAIANSFVAGCWIERRKVWSEEPFRSTYLIEALNEFGFTKGTLGCEFGEEQRFGMPLSELHEVQRDVAGLKWVDASKLLWDLRVMKSPAEVERIREANRITVQIGDRFVDMAHVGMTTREAGKLLQRLALDEGADWLPLCLFLITGPNGNHQYPPATDRPFQRGDLLYTDLGAQYMGYSADVNRVIHFGDPPEPVTRYYRVVADLQRFLLDKIRPGAVLSQIRRALDEEYSRHGLPLRTFRAGHGVGMQPTEAPSLNAASQVVLQPGMTITLEPGFPTPEGYYFTVEHDVLITETGCENLTPAPLEMQIVMR